MMQFNARVPPQQDLSADPTAMQMLSEIARQPWRLGLWGVLGDYLEDMGQPRDAADSLRSYVRGYLDFHAHRPRRWRRQQMHLLVRSMSEQLYVVFGYVEPPPF